ncbi:uncharacterized protein EI90DRAFT_3146815 [Cantharellus anzutake]|uniref:uncharacterized protein n=1 Tax=Cantharellus anzutake TaxID=1750568 RepID=UPI0019048ADA|nr:uncharacterized protein EI90DRAFT_3146815 [Cantharellus anzutake]KAF8324548.1 hypothetical protein EI90DRAFT_3146815 [Cantharellus anzutake]
MSGFDQLANRLKQKLHLGGDSSFGSSGSPSHVGSASWGEQPQHSPYYQGYPSYGASAPPQNYTGHQTPIPQNDYQRFDTTWQGSPPFAGASRPYDALEANHPIPPPIPPRPVSQQQRSKEAGAVIPSPPAGRPAAGAIYAPGTYPTPELPLYPLGRHVILHSQSESDFTDKTIRDALSDTSSPLTVYLPRRSRWLVHSTIQLSDFQELATEGYPTDEKEMAIIDAQEDCDGHVLHAFSKSGIRIRNLVIEGNKEKYGWNEKGAVMVQLGGAPARNQVLDRCILRNTRHWSTVQAFEGATNIRITNNIIGPAGVGCDEAEFRWADGISYACEDGLVAGNLVRDTTDGAIVLFSAPGSLVTSNTIVTEKRLGLGAINMVDFNPHEGKYLYTRVDHNTIVTAGNYLEIGIGQGPSVWGAQSKRQIIRGAYVTNNLITRDLRHIDGPVWEERLGTGNIGYGFPVGSDVANWVCIGNVSEPSVQWGNAEGDEADISSLVLQNEFKEGKVWGLIAIKPGESKAMVFHGGNDLRARLGDNIDLSGGIRILFRQEDAELCVISLSEGGRVLWQAGVSGNINPHRPDYRNATLTFSEGGKLAIVNSENQNNIWFDFTPHIPRERKQDHEQSKRPPSRPRLVFSSSKPHVRITSPSPENFLLYASSYSYPHQYGFPFGSYTARSIPSSPRNPGGGAFVYTMSPERRFVIIYTQKAFHELHWPLDPGAFRIVHDFGGETSQDDRKCTLFFQGDGNLVLSTGEGQATWASGTCGDREAVELRFGDGSPQEPYVELIGRNGQRVWST